MFNIHEEVKKLGYTAYKSEDECGVILCDNKVPYEERFKNVKVYISGKEFSENDTPEKTWELIKNKINV